MEKWSIRLGVILAQDKSLNIDMDSQYETGVDTVPFEQGMEIKPEQPDTTAEMVESIESKQTEQIPVKEPDTEIIDEDADGMSDLIQAPKQKATVEEEPLPDGMQVEFDPPEERQIIDPNVERDFGLDRQGGIAPIAPIVVLDDEDIDYVIWPEE